MNKSDDVTRATRKKLGIKEIHNFITQNLENEIRERYKSFQILSEADLQSHVWAIIYEYLNKCGDKTKKMIKVLNKPYLKDIGIHPDLVIFRRKKPWIIIELKEWRIPKIDSAKKDLERMLLCKNHFSKNQRGYFLHVSRDKGASLFSDHSLKGIKVYFSEVQIYIDHKNKHEEKKWKERFKDLAKYTRK